MGVVICDYFALGSENWTMTQDEELIQQEIEVRVWVWERRETSGLVPAKHAEGMTIIAAGNLGSM
jgi:hypothetical protein